MSDRAKWTRLRRWIRDTAEHWYGLCERRNWPDAVWDAFPEERAQRLVCVFAGHCPQPDQCLRPEHDLCAWCMASTPNAAPRVSAGEPKEDA